MSALRDLESDRANPSQASLFDAPRPGSYRATDPMPSRKAAAANLTARQGQKKAMLKRLLLGPATAASLSDLTGGQRNCASSRLGEMEKAGLVTPCGYEYPPRGQGGTPRTVYCLTDNGRRDVELMVGGS